MTPKHDQKSPCQYLCYICDSPSDGLLCPRCRDEIDRGDMGRVTDLVGLPQARAAGEQAKGGTSDA